MIASARIYKDLQDQITVLKKKLENPMLTQVEIMKIETEIRTAENEQFKIVNG